MRFYSKLNERELDRILAGKATSGDFADVATFFQELRSLDEAPSPLVEGRHLAAIFAEAVRRPSLVPDPQIPVRRGRRLSNPFRRLAARATIAAVGLAAVAAFGGAAYAGALPTPIQGEVAHIARHVGIDLPGDSRHSPAPGTPRTPGASHTGNTDQSNGQGNEGDVGGAQGNSNQTTDGSQGSSQGANSGSQNTETNGQAQPNEQGTQGLSNDNGTPNGGAGAGGDQQGDNAPNGTGN